MRKPLQIGITGGIGTGKSLVRKIFSCLGAPGYDADSRAKALMTTDGILITSIKKEFGNLSYNADGVLNREYLGQVVFSDPDKLKTLNGLVHPRVGVDFENWASRQTFPYLVKEAALLFESGSYKKLDKVIVVTAPEEIRIRRVIERDPKRTEQMVREIIKNQLSQAELSQRADFIVTNDEQSMLIPQILKLHSGFIA